jgi:hypothetical protein
LTRDSFLAISPRCPCGKVSRRFFSPSHCTTRECGERAGTISAELCAFYSERHPCNYRRHRHGSLHERQRTLLDLLPEGDLAPSSKGETSNEEEKMMSKTFKGRTEDADSAFLGADFWKKGTKITGTVRRKFESGNGPCYTLDLLDPVEIEGEEHNEVSIGNLTGFRMALQAAGLEELNVGDQVHLVCTGLKPTKKGSPRPNFEIEVTRS